jgi:hypothetical protein
VFIAPRLVGGAGARTPVAGVGVGTLREALALAEWQVEQLEGDILIHGRRSERPAPVETALLGNLPELGQPVTPVSQDQEGHRQDT